MRTMVFSVVALGTCLVQLAYAGSSLETRAAPTVAAPECSLTCLGTLIPTYCTSSADTVCICTNTELAAELLPCTIAACNVTDALRLARYQAEVCDVPNDMTRYWQQIHTYAVLVPVTTIFVALRIFARVRLRIGLGPDDWVLLVGFTLYVCMTSTAWVIAVTGFGQHTFWLLTIQVERALKFFYISEMLYLSTITFTKLSLLLFFRRIFPSSGFRLATVCVGVFIIASNISLFMALTFQCIPAHGIWTNWKYKVPPVQCINVFAAVYVAAGMSILHDMIILCMPIPTLWALNLNIRKKASLIVMFGVGSFVIVASVLRLPSLMKMGASSDPSFDQAPVAFWTNLETSVGIICACLPACRSLLGHYFPGLQMLNNNSNGRKTPGYTTPTSNTKEYFHKKRAARDSFFELGDRSTASSPAESKIKKRQSTMHDTIPGKSGPDDTIDDPDGESIVHIPTNSPGPIEERFVPADRKGLGHMATVVGGETGDRARASPDSSGHPRTGRNILMTRTLDQRTTSRL